jgi:S-formylglutathione hydrolase FrmB
MLGRNPNVSRPGRWTLVAVALSLVLSAGPVGQAAAQARSVGPQIGATESAGADEVRIVSERRLGDRGLELTIVTPAFTAPVRVQVFLPRGYSEHTGRRWPVVYYTAGTFADERSFNEQYEGERLTRDFPAIMVAPAGNAGYWSDWYNRGAGGPPQYETYVIDQLVPLVDRRFRTLGTRQSRAVMGESMGGYGALMLAARHPDVFVAASSLSGAVDTNTPLVMPLPSISSATRGLPDDIYGPRATQEVRWRAHNPWDLADNLRAVDVQVRTSSGSGIDPSIGETPVDTPVCVNERIVYEASASLHERLAALGVPHVWRNYGLGCHSPANFKRQIVDTLARFRTVLLRWDAPSSVTYQSAEPSFTVWGWTVSADPMRAREWLYLKGADRQGLTLAGSGLTHVTTPPLFKDSVVVEVRSDGAEQRLRPDEEGRLIISVDLGPANRQQQYTYGSVNPAVTRRVTFATAGGTRARTRR